MALDETGLLVKLEANVSKWEKDFNRAIVQQQRASQRMESLAKQNATRIGNAYKGIGANIGASFGKLAGPLAGGISAAIIARQVRNYTELADAATQMRNALRVAGLEGDDLSAVYGKLYPSAQRNAAPISSLTALYSKLALTQKELGVSGDDLIRFTDGIAVALKVAGTDASAASGSLLQLSQALGGGVVRAEEFNSILEGVPTIAQAVARGLKEAGGSVAELRKLVVDGQVSSTAFFHAFEAGSAELRAQAETSQSTVKQAFTRLGNSLVTVVGDFDQASGASAGFADAIDDLANGLDGFDTEGFVTKVQRVIDILAEAEAAGANWLNGIGNSDFFKNLNLALGITDDSGKVLNPDVSAAEKKIAVLEDDVATLQAAIESNTSLGFDNTAAIARLREVRNELAALRAEAANLPKYSTDQKFNPTNADSGTFFNIKDYAPPPVAPEIRQPVSIADHPASGGAGGKGGGRGSKGGGSKAKGGRSGGGGAAREKLNDFEREAKGIRERTALMEIQSRVYGDLASSAESYGDAAQFAETKAALLAAAQQAGKQITPALTAEIDAMAKAYSETGAKAGEAEKKLGEIEDNAKRGASALSDLFTSATEGGDAFAGSLRNIAKQILDGALQRLLLSFAQSRAPGAGIIAQIGGVLGGGFADGGFTGAGSKYEPAGIVHKGEFVVSKSATQRIGVGNLERLHQRALQGYASGGLVGAAEKATRSVSDSPSAAARASAPAITINSPVTVNATGGTPDQNADLARQIAREHEQAMRGLIQSELVRQMRPGAMLARG